MGPVLACTAARHYRLRGTRGDPLFRLAVRTRPPHAVLRAAERHFGLRPFDYASSAQDTDASRRLGLRPGRLVTGELQHGQRDTPREFDRLAAAANVRVILRAHVAELLADSQIPGRIAGARALVAPDTPLTVKARLTVLARAESVMRGCFSSGTPITPRALVTSTTSWDASSWSTLRSARALSSPAIRVARTT